MNQVSVTVCYQGTTMEQSWFLWQVKVRCHGKCEQIKKTKNIILCWANTNMDEFHFPVRTTFIFLLLSFHGTTTTAQTTEQLCTAPFPVEFSENNMPGALVTTIDTLDGVTLTIVEPLNPKFILDENQLKAQEVLDYEQGEKVETINIRCFQAATGAEGRLTITVLLLNVNDNSPMFSSKSYTLDVDEFTPPRSLVGAFPAQDLDLHPDLYYTLTPDSSYFSLRSSTEPDLLVHADLDYDTVQHVNLVLTAQDTPLGGAEIPSFTATTTIAVNITDVDNRPPWFDPCKRHPLGGGVVVCQSPGYTTTVTLNERVDGAMVLKPKQIIAVDGDTGINEEVVFSLLSGNKNDIFAVEESSGNITMLKAADVLESVTLTVLASQKNNSHQFSTTTVTIRIHVESMHKPRFQRRSYHAVVSAVGTMALDPTNDDMPLQIIAVDEDYNATEGINPYISYSIIGNSDFNLINGFLFMARKVEDATFSLQVTATDTITDESDTAELTVEVKSGVTTTIRPPPSVSSETPPSTIRTTSSTGSSSSTGPSSSTSSSGVTPTLHTNSPSSSSGPVSQSTSSVTATSHTSHPVTPSTSDPNASTQTTLTTNQPPTDGSSSTTTAPPRVGGYRVEDMAALGASLALLLFVCLLIIGLLVYRLKRGDKASQKIFEASRFLSTLGPGGPKEGIQFTNEAFQKDEDRGSVSSAGNGGETSKGVWDTEEEPRVSELKFSDLPEENEKEVKPILTKERRVEDGYKSVWFKEDIDPNAMNQVVLIPDSREEEEDEEEEKEEEEEEEEEGSLKILVSDTDLDSGLGVKIEDPGEDSERDEDLNIDL
ncbi:cadherin-related family member 5-like isoform X1 [Gouania willdenowi]|nr:cadherin-related family member 5-like isoform X1 [Gouania willdenowi]